MKIGIGVDNYKIEKFKAELAKLGFEKIGSAPFTKNTSIITVDNVPAERLHDIQKLCVRLQIDFNRSN
jgi:hypothetical protein